MSETQNAVVPALAYDGGCIWVPMDLHDQAVDWFTKHTGWIVQHQFNNEPSDEANVIMRERKTILGFGTCIESAEYRDGVDPLHLGISLETNVRWCWRTKDLEKTRKYF